MKRLWPILVLLIPLGGALPFLPVRRIAWRLVGGDDNPYSREVVWMMSRQQADGSWDEGPADLQGHPLRRPGMTGLALLTLMGHGYSYLSKDEYEWYVSGQSIRSGFQSLMRVQLPDGTFQTSGGTLDHLLATFALSESYGLTGSNLHQTSAQAATDALGRKILAGDLRTDPTLHAWASMTLWSAEASGLSIDPRARDRILAFYDARKDGPDAGEVMARAGLSGKRPPPQAVDAVAAGGPKPESEDFARWYWGTRAIYQFDGPSGPTWKAWIDPVRTTLVRSQSSKGCWTGRNRGETFVRTCLGSMTLQIYFGSPAVFPPRRP